MSAAWFVDGAYALKCWSSLDRFDKLDFLKVRELLEQKHLNQAGGERIEDAYYFNAEMEPSSNRQNAFHNALQFPPPTGPGLRVKLYWLQEKQLYWPAHMGGEPVIHPSTGQPYRQTTQKAVDVGLAFHLMRSFSKRRWTTLFLFAGDSDFHEAIQHLVENEGVNLVLIGTMQTISQELRPYGQHILELDKIASQMSRA